MTHRHQARCDWSDFENIAPGVVAALRALGNAVDCFRAGPAEHLIAGEPA